MKKKIALVLAIVMLVIACMPVYMFAADEGLENAIKSVKQYFTIPDSFKEFNYGISSMGDKKIWELNWNSKVGTEGSIGASVDSNGEIINYSFYKYTDYGNTKKLPKVSRQEAKVKAEEIIKKINPGIFDSLKFVSGYQGGFNDEAYYFNYLRTHNGIPFPENSIGVEINRQTGELQRYSKQWNDGINFPSSDKALSLEEAQKAYIKNLGLRLTYNSIMDENKSTVYAAYTPIHNGSYYIDAFTGEKVFLGHMYYGGDQDAYKVKFNGAAMEGKGEAEVLTPEELDAVNEASKLLSTEESEKKARELKFLELDKGFIVRNATLERNWPSKTEFVWNIYFEKEVIEDKEGYGYVNVSIDARTGEVKGFSRNYPDTDKKEAKFDSDKSKAEVEKLIKELQPEKFAQSEYEDSKNDAIIFYSASEKPTSYNFNYVRKVNGIMFPDNAISATFDAVNGKVISFNVRWFEADFPSLENIVPLEKIYEKLFSEIGLKLQYNVDNTIDESTPAKKIRVIQPQHEKDIKLRLVYSLDTSKPSRFDANTGDILDYDGKPYKENKAEEYSDISGHYAEEVIKVLAESGIALEGPELKPNEQIKQKDFLLLISQILNSGYQFFGKTALKGDIEVDDLYKMMVREGIVKPDEKNPEAQLTREESVKFIIRALKYDKVAELGDIFNCTFKDKDEINPGLIGYVVIAKGLKIVSGDGEYFRPKNKLTRADAIILIYNYLQI